MAWDIIKSPKYPSIIAADNHKDISFQLNLVRKKEEHNVIRLDLSAADKSITMYIIGLWEWNLTFGYTYLAC